MGNEGLIVTKASDARVDAVITEHLSPAQKELLEALRAKDIKRVKSCSANVWSTILTLKTLLLVRYPREIYGFDDLINIIENEGIILRESTAKLVRRTR